MSNKNEPEKNNQPGKNATLSERQALRDFFNLLLKVDARLHPELYRHEKSKSDLPVEQKIKNNNENGKNTSSNDLK